ncbi:hypothetical protein BKA58DRAFT_406707 [Alternaria rosae]|uniref:uncharacterized protein n=1 Tax=Alternaria rosae TaxID=1187941 RepID=UPI001E8D9516|nr:uncharacterized protein BKA58DRAFT_406707 [Alternaria rosae]KAH6848487.1 hypothetical protein BKA58DRAFT_406707 [Alternaria rosae]
MDSIRNETINDFYDTLVDLNAKIPNLARGSNVTLIVACMEAGTPPFWDNFTPLSVSQLATLAKQLEGEAADAFDTKMQGNMWDQTTQEKEYCKAAAMVGPNAAPKGLERFAERARKMVEDDTMEMNMEKGMSGLMV